VIVDVATQLPALLGSHARVAIRVLSGNVARRHLLRRRRASGRAPDAPAALALLGRRRIRGEQNQEDSAQRDQEPHDSLHRILHSAVCAA